MEDIAPVVEWRKSRRCASGHCVEVAHVDDTFALRDSTQPDGPVLSFGAAAWANFIAGVREGQFETR